MAMLRGPCTTCVNQALYCLSAGHSKLTPGAPLTKGGDAIGRLRLAGGIGSREICAQMIRYERNTGNLRHSVGWRCEQVWYEQVRKPTPQLK